MTFLTKIDISDNRQIKQRDRTVTVLSGATSFGIPFSGLTSGPNLSSSGVSQTYNLINSSFSGNSGTTIYTWYDSRMSLANTHLSVITPSNSATTQNTGGVFTASTTTVIDGNTIALAYTGVSFDVTVTGMTDLGSGNYSGNILTNTLNILSADTLDFTGRTIWVDVSGITRTDKLIVGDVSAITETVDVNGNARFRNIGSSASTGALYYTSNGTLTTNTSDYRLKTNIIPIDSALDKIRKLRGVYYGWKESPDIKRIGFIAQEVHDAIPELTFINDNSPDKYMGVHYENVTPLLVEAIKEIVSGNTIINKSILETQTILAEDNNIELNYNGSVESSIGGGIIVLHALGEDKPAQIITDKDGNWVTNNDLKPERLTIPTYTPSSSNDEYGSDGNITKDDEYIYVKSGDKWKRCKLEDF